MAAPALVLVFDGGCPFCRYFAELSELRSGIAGLEIRDGRSDSALRAWIAQRGFHLRDGAVLIEGDTVLHGAAAIAALCERMRPSAPLLMLLGPLFQDRSRARLLYPLLLASHGHQPHHQLQFVGHPAAAESDAIADPAMAAAPATAELMEAGREVQGCRSVAGPHGLRHGCCAPPA
jgi:predicted DCC family thiol-disulfide oxidoreductase YuxK